MNSACALLGIRRPPWSGLHPVLRDQSGADETAAQQRQEEGREDRAPAEHRRHPRVARRRTSLREAREHCKKAKGNGLGARRKRTQDPLYAPAPGDFAAAASSGNAGNSLPRVSDHRARRRSMYMYLARYTSVSRCTRANRISLARGSPPKPLHTDARIRAFLLRGGETERKRKEEKKCGAARETRIFPRQRADVKRRRRVLRISFIRVAQKANVARAISRAE